MSTVWRGLCLDHNPAIEFDLIVNNRELIRSDDAVAELRKGEGFHAHCDVVAGGYSYPLVRVRCPHATDRCGVTSSSQEYRIEDLRVVHQASLVRVAGDAEMLQTALSEWFRVNRCWTPDRLSRLLESER